MQSSQLGKSWMRMVYILNVSQANRRWRGRCSRFVILLRVKQRVIKEFMRWRHSLNKLNSMLFLPRYMIPFWSVLTYVSQITSQASPRAKIHQFSSSHASVKTISGMELQRRKSKCVGFDFRSSLCREAEKSRALGLPLPKDTYFRPRIGNRLLSICPGIFSSLSSFLVLVGGSQSLVALRAALLRGFQGINC